MGQDYNEILCQAVDTIVSGRIANLSYDKTIQVTIDSIDANNPFKYMVRFGQDVIFEAYSNGSIYQMGDIVYVTIPQGDWTQQKCIIGKKNAQAGQIYYIKNIVPKTQKVTLQNGSEVELLVDLDIEKGILPLDKG